MIERTPPTGTVRHAFVKAHPFPYTTDVEERYAEFDRWLARVQAEAQVKVLREVAMEFYRDGEGDWDGYGVSHALTIDADRIAREAGIETGESNE